MDLPELLAIFGPGVADAVLGAGWWFWVDVVICNSVKVSFLLYLLALMFNCIRKEDIDYSPYEEGEWRVPGGARNVDGRIIVKVTKTWKESTLSKIVQLTEEAHLNKPKLQRWLDEFGERYSKVVVGLSLAIALLGPVLFKWPFMSTTACRGSIYRALGLMVAASPCALAVAP